MKGSEIEAWTFSTQGKGTVSLHGNLAGAIAALAKLPVSAIFWISGLIFLGYIAHEVRLAVCTWLITKDRPRR